MKRINILSHTDLDGVTSAILANKIAELNFPNSQINIHFVNYGEITSKIESLINKTDVLYLTDLSLGSVELNKLVESKNTQVYIFDHHKTSQSTINTLSTKPNIHIYFDSSGLKCASDILYEEYQRITTAYDENLYYLVKATRSRDLWIHDTSEGNDYTYAIEYLGCQYIFDLLTQDLSKIYSSKQPIEVQMVNRIATQAIEDNIRIANKTKIEKQVVALKKTGKKISGVVIVAITCGNIPEVGHSLVNNYKIPAWTLLVDLKRMVISVRLNDNALKNTNITADYIAGLWGGGGHSYAAGGRLDMNLIKEDYLKPYMNAIVELFEKELLMGD